MNNYQAGILAPVPGHARDLTFAQPDVSVARTLLAERVQALSEIADGETIVVGIGAPLVTALGAVIDGLQVAPAQAATGVAIPSTPAAVWCWLRGEDRGDILHTARGVSAVLDGVFALRSSVDAFRYRGGLDLTGYEDGTENPTGDAALQTAFVDAGELAGSSFVAVQQWHHDLDRFAAMPPGEQDHTIGRRRSDNEELEDAPESAHVKRTAQESFTPEAFLLRRSMPWADAHGQGLVFVAFAGSFAAFEAQLARMIGLQDGIVDALFKFTRPSSGAYYWCPPVAGRTLDCSALGL
jgi:putative iron-dependent peroxidase